jgi:hemolysin III
MSRCTWGLGRAAVFVLPQLLRGTGLTGPGPCRGRRRLYTLGGVTYALRCPDPWPRWFGYHEIFHARTIAAFACQHIAVYHAA